MTNKRKEKNYDMGYKKPPKHSQWPKGVSGNPGGAPKKKKAPEKRVFNPARHPTREIIREEAQRTVILREGDERKELTATQAVMMALANTAIKGGVHAQRAFIALQMQEDERRQAELREDFNFWANIKRENQVAINAAKQAGIKPPRLLPHPDDIILNYHRLEVDIRGPLDEEDYQVALKRAAYRDFYRELFSYFNEDIELVEGDDDATKIGLTMLVFMTMERSSPPSMKHDAEAFEKHLWDRLMLPRRSWAKLIDEQCDALGLPKIGFIPETRKFAAYPISTFGITWRNGRIVFEDEGG